MGYNDKFNHCLKIREDLRQATFENFFLETFDKHGELLESGLGECFNSIVELKMSLSSLEIEVQLLHLNDTLRRLRNPGKTLLLHAAWTVRKTQVEAYLPLVRLLPSESEMFSAKDSSYRSLLRLKKRYGSAVDDLVRACSQGLTYGGGRVYSAFVNGHCLEFGVESQQYMSYYSSLLEALSNALKIEENSRVTNNELESWFIQGFDLSAIKEGDSEPGTFLKPSMQQLLSGKLRI
ncbi:hypothetical protein [Nitrincola sp.]|uniref:hypothetical protein n=1 Tax=Nitrincola sp. TaxID=1926584 RepID=UPI003A94DF79